MAGRDQAVSMADALQPRNCRCDPPMSDAGTCWKCSYPVPADADSGSHPIAVPQSDLTPQQVVVVLAIQAFHAEHARIPRMADWPRCDGTYPSYAQVARVFGSFKAGILAAGFTPDARGRKSNGRQPEPGPVEVTVDPSWDEMARAVEDG